MSPKRVPDGTLATSKQRPPLCGCLFSILVIIGLVIGGVILIGNLLEDNEVDSASNGETEEESQDEPDEGDASEEPEAQEPEPADDLSVRVEEAALSSAGIHSLQDLSESAVSAVTELEDVNVETVRVYVQDQLSEDQKDDVARWFFNMTCEQVPELETIVVRDAEGVDSNHYAGHLSALPACQ